MAPSTLCVWCTHTRTGLLYTCVPFFCPTQRETIKIYTLDARSSSIQDVCVCCLLSLSLSLSPSWLLSLSAEAERERSRLCRARWVRRTKRSIAYFCFSLSLFGSHELYVCTYSTVPLVLRQAKPPTGLFVPVCLCVPLYFRIIPTHTTTDHLE